MNCLFCGVKHNDSWASTFYFFECGNAYDDASMTWIDVCCSKPRWPQ